MAGVKVRSWWCADDALYCEYHDEEWGVPVHDDRKIFEMLILEGFQAGLSWITILRKRENFRKAFKNFDARKVARFGKADVARLMNDAGIIRNRLKIEGAITNAKCFLEVQKEFGGSLRGVTIRYQPGEFYGEIPILLDSTTIASLRAHESSRVIRLDRGERTQAPA